MILTAVLTKYGFNMRGLERLELKNGIYILSRIKGNDWKPHNECHSLLERQV